MDYVHDEYYQDSITMESSILDRFKGLDNPKKIVKLAGKLALATRNKLQKKLCLDIASSRDPVGYLAKCFKMIEDCSYLMDKFISEGAHGMIILGTTTYPVTVDTLSNWLREDDKWTEEDEIEIQYKAAENWLRAYNKTHFLGKVVLFDNFGFSGVPRLVEVRLPSSG